ncbi:MULTISPECIES: hypothetical protein [Janthinobacterium]|uniref:Uncharacterized protein n=1 Tax=Janthinobacterium lividum TaxID=29581 RepID=A0ABU0XNF5_9BURK|nr:MULTISPECIES: hypothetical protein [Janthinobacterium]MDQ4625050.1 hypothetical protein [Janthinobacterium lividum]MDQ4673347.1 hypothetical protein [Janthinobacterium lividum]MDQ4684077.1 hypothetical protein [Janthinobacterium lividum]OEZ50307.1 hypothetical protein JAB1_14220 [Janthinobacterium sp. MP5059B]
MMNNDKKQITELGGPTKLAELLGYAKQGGVQRVQNWMVRGIPSKVRLDHPEIFAAAFRSSAESTQASIQQTDSRIDAGAKP